jgi:cold shock CspA family protein
LFNVERGFGFVHETGENEQYFLHASELKRCRIDPAALRDGERLSFEVKQVAQHGLTSNPDICRQPVADACNVAGSQV